MRIYRKEMTTRILLNPIEFEIQLKDIIFRANGLNYYLFIYKHIIRLICKRIKQVKIATAFSAQLGNVSKQRFLCQIKCRPNK